MRSKAMNQRVKHPFANVYCGTAVNPQGPTGVTVLYFEGGAACAADIRGGSIASRDMGAVTLDDAWGEIDGLCFTGGSVLGLGVTEGILEVIQKTRGQSVDFDNLPAIPTCAIYDFGTRDNAVVPDAALGKKAMDNAKPKEIPVGAMGAGASARVGDYLDDAQGERAGQGAAFLHWEGIDVLAFSVVNASGVILNRQGEVVGGNRTGSGERELIFDSLMRGEAKGSPSPANTVLTAIITNAALDRIQLSRLAAMAHAALGRCIEPFHSEYDGDVLFAVSTAQKRLPSDITLSDLGVIAGRCAQNAILSVFG